MDEKDIDEMIQSIRPDYMDLCKELYTKYIKSREHDPIAVYVAMTIMQAMARRKVQDDARIPDSPLFKKDLFFLEGIAMVLANKINLDKMDAWVTMESEKSKK